MTSHILQSETETIAFAAQTASTLNAGNLLCLHGTLGMGKSVFARALIRSLCQNEALEVPSPTFTLIQTYEAPNFEIYHFDLYRLEDPEEIYELGWEDAINGGLSIIEWPTRLGSLLPSRRLDITLKALENNPQARQITIEDLR